MIVESCLILIGLILLIPLAFISLIFGIPRSSEVGGTWPLFIVSRCIPLVWVLCTVADTVWLVKLVGERLR